MRGEEKEAEKQLDNRETPSCGCICEHWDAMLMKCKSGSRLYTTKSGIINAHYLNMQWKELRSTCDHQTKIRNRELIEKVVLNYNPFHLYLISSLSSHRGTFQVGNTEQSNRPELVSKVTVNRPLWIEWLIFTPVPSPRLQSYVYFSMLYDCLPWAICSYRGDHSNKVEIPEEHSATSLLVSQWCGCCLFLSLAQSSLPSRCALCHPVLILPSLIILSVAVCVCLCVPHLLPFPLSHHLPLRSLIQTLLRWLFLSLSVCHMIKTEYPPSLSVYNCNTVLQLTDTSCFKFDHIYYRLWFFRTYPRVLFNT